MADIGTAYVRIAPNMTGIQSKISSGFRGAGGKIAQQMGGEIKGKSAFIIGAIAGVAQAAVTKAMRLVSNSIGDAVSRVDTLNNAPKVLQNLGFASDASKKAVDGLSKGIEGLPTRLDDAASALTAIASASGLGLQEAQDLTLAFNNMALAGGKGPAEAQRALTQFTQALGKGKFEMQDFKTLTEVMPAQMAQLAKSLLGPGATAQQLQQAMSDGEVSLDDFNKGIVALNEKGGKGFASFQDQAKDATAGIGTGITNMQTAITRGIANIIQTIGSDDISSAIGKIGTTFEGVLNQIAVALPPVINMITNVFGFIARNKDIFAPIAAGVLAMVAAWKIWTMVTKIAAAVQLAFNVVMAANPIGIVILAIVGLVAALTYFFTKTELGKSIIQNFGKVITKVWQGIKTGLAAVGAFFGAVFGRIKGIVGGAINFIKARWKLILAILFGPVGIAVGLIISNIGRIKAGFAAGYNYIRSLWSRLSGFFRNIFSNIKNAFRSIPSVGKSIVQGLWSGISGMGGWLKDKIIGFVADKIPGPVKKALGINSPSKLFAQFGRNVDEGFIQGIEQKAGKVEGAVNNMANRAISGMPGPAIDPSVSGLSSIAGGNAGGSGNTTHQTVTIHKIVLASEGAVKQMFKELNQDTINVRSGLTPVQGANS